MTSLCISLAFAALTLAAGAFILYRRRRGVRTLLRRTVVVHTKDGKSFRGVLVGEYADCLALEHADYLDEKVTVWGRMVLLRENISWVQDVTTVHRADASTEPPPDRFEVSRDEVA